MDSAELDEQSERGISKSSAEKGTCEKRIEVNDMRRSSARGLYQCDRKTSAQSNQKMFSKKIVSHSRVCRNIVYLRHAFLKMRTV